LAGPFLPAEATPLGPKASRKGGGPIFMLR
jgi:hypothetical protein